MSSPGPDETTRRLATAATAVGPTRPGLAVALARSDLSDQEMQSVGGFTSALQLSVTRRLAGNSGARFTPTAEERNQLAGVGEVLAEEEIENDSRSWFEKATDWAAGALSNTGSALLENPVTEVILDGFEWLGNAAKMPFRLVSDEIDGDNDDEIESAMVAEGYDPESTTSYLAFMFSQGDSLYHDLDTVRDVHGDEYVDLALQMHADPEQFHEDLVKTAPEEAAALNAKLNSAEFQDAFDAVDRKHISPGRDIARVILSDKLEDGAAFTTLSGALDAAYIWFTDPTLILGRAAHALRAADALGRNASLGQRAMSAIPRLAKRRAGLQHMTDQAGIEALLAVDETGAAATKVGKGWQRLLADAKDLRAADEAGDEAKRAGIYAVMNQRYGVLMDLLPEINGARVIPDGAAVSKFRMDDLTTRNLVTKGNKPIETLEELTAHLVSTNGLLRINNGMAAREHVVMPGRLSWRAERTAAAEARTILGRNKAKKTSRWIDYTKPHDLLPDDAEQKLLDEALEPEAVRRGLAQNDLMLKTSILSARAARAKFERVARRFQTQLPKVERLDLGDPGAARTVEQIARMYLNRGDAAMLASAYALADDINAKRAVVRGMLVQSFHASGLSRSEVGRSFMERFIGDQSALSRQKYGYAKTSEIATDRGSNVQVALYPDQISRTVILPSMREMHYLATKFAVGGYIGRSKVANVRALGQSSGMDSMIGLIKLGWITTAAGGLRNAVDEIANFAAYGMSRDVLRARALFTRVTKEQRGKRRSAAKKRLAMISTLGRDEADDRIAFQLGQGLRSFEDAKLTLERAQRGKAAVDDVERKLKQRVTDANVARAEAGTYRYRALDEHEKAKRAGAPEEELAPLRERATYWSDEVAKADDVVKRHDKAYTNRKAEKTKVQESFAKKGVPSVRKAERDLAAAKAELERAQNLQVAISHRLPYAFRWAADTVNDVLVGAVLGKALTVFGKDWKITDEHVRWANELVDRELNITFRDGIFQSHHADTALLYASDEAAMDYHRAGLMARKYSFQSQGWGNVEIDGGAGLEAWAKVLQLRFGDPSSPAHSWVQLVREMSRRPATGKAGTLDEFTATGEELLHGTSAKFDTFEGGHVGTSKRGAGDRIYMTRSPEVAERFASGSNRSKQPALVSDTWFDSLYRDPEVTRGLSDETAARLRDVYSKQQKAYADPKATAARKKKWMDARDEAEAAARREWLVTNVLGKGHAVTLGNRTIRDADEVARLTEDELFQVGMLDAAYDPRVVRAKVYGKTLDLRTRRYTGADGKPISRVGNPGGIGNRLDYEEIEPRIPADLDAALKAEKLWHPKKQGDTFGHERSRALTDWMRANGYGKAIVDDAGESGLESYVVLPETIQHGANDPAKAYAKQLAKAQREKADEVIAAARDSVRARVDDADMRHFVESAEIFRWYKGTKIAKGDDETLAMAKDEYADRVSADLAQALGPDGKLSPTLLDELAEGRVPDRSWLAQLSKEERPEHTIGQLWAPYNPAMRPGEINRGVTGMMLKAYDKVVTDQINALSRNPLTTALYMRARENTKPYVKHLIDEGGFAPEIAEDMARRIAAQHAEVEALKHIDNPYVSSQFSMLARNYWAFVRAQEDWLRRWGRTIKDNPEVIRKAQLLIHGGESVGFLEQDDQGDLHFVYPGSGLMLDVFGKFFGVLNSTDGVRIPMQGELSSQILFTNPSLDNPLGFSGTPLISLPWKVIERFLGPDHVLMTSSMDKVINGDLGAGRDWWEMMLPSWANRIIGGVIPTEDMNSKLGAAIQSTLANFEAAGMLDDPQYQAPEGQARLLHAFQVSVQNDLLTTALFGFFAVAAPQYNASATENAEGFQGIEADWSAHITGLRSLKDEARKVFATLPYEEAKAYWAAVHPNESVLAPMGAGSRTTVGADAASAPATIAAARHMQENHEFFQQYGGKGGIAAYFIPQGRAGTANGEFSDVAYRAQLELGIRDHKSLDEYFTDLVTSRGFQQYFAAKDDIDDRKARAAGSSTQTAQLDAEWAETRGRIMAANPLLAARLAQYAESNAMTGVTLQSLYRLAADESPSTLKALGPNRTGVLAMLEAKEQFDRAIDSLGDRRGSAANRRRQQIKSSYDAQITALATQFSGLADLARGIFRPIS